MSIVFGYAGIVVVLLVCIDAFLDHIIRYRRSGLKSFFGEVGIAILLVILLTMLVLQGMSLVSNLLFWIVWGLSNMLVAGFGYWMDRQERVRYPELWRRIDREWETLSVKDKLLFRYPDLRAPADHQQ